MTADNLAAIRQAAATEGWAELLAAMARLQENETREMFRTDTSDERRREIAWTTHGRQQVLEWYGAQIKRATDRKG